MANPKYSNQRERVTPPHLSLDALRSVVGLTLDQVCERYESETGNRLTRGALSAIEGGLRGVSSDTLTGLEAAYGLRPGSLIVNYEPKTRKAVAA